MSTFEFLTSPPTRTAATLALYIPNITFMKRDHIQVPDPSLPTFKSCLPVLFYTFHLAMTSDWQEVSKSKKPAQSKSRCEYRLEPSPHGTKYCCDPCLVKCTSKLDIQVSALSLGVLHIG